ncbi:DUF2259 domain-containing protein [Peteryoungia ipomoeae]|uniref:DUF2259 domain-containing protein n=1 Tax=Peteryoungia ipomoeae TaxID=1210932 RepID=A0A4V4HNB9_9HYPH|nr:DUF2259 domain-containing protein [Peteryoungia ipomoeae]THV25016.1 DUF2259 domain-containing protein [Peteryoungia ipomoeae]
MNLSRLIATTVAALLCVPTAQAGDVAEMRPHGFSADGRYFAYEEFGEQDGSGFPYATIYIVDTKTDSFVPGSPVETRIRDEKASLGEARRKAALEIDPLFKTLGIGDDPGYLAAYNPVSELVEEPKALRYQPVPSLYIDESVRRLRLETVSMDGPEDCKRWGIAVQGFRLLIAADDSPETARTVYEDKRIPESRRCPSNYAIGGVVTPGYRTKAPHIVMVQVASLGFEGNDIRWIAIPIRP